MKIILVLLAALFMQIGIYSQDKIDPPKLFDRDTLSIYDNRSSFVLGWNWGGPGRSRVTSWQI